MSGTSGAGRGQVGEGAGSPHSTEPHAGESSYDKAWEL